MFVLNCEAFELALEGVMDCVLNSGESGALLLE